MRALHARELLYKRRVPTYIEIYYKVIGNLPSDFVCYSVVNYGIHSLHNTLAPHILRKMIGARAIRDSCHVLSGNYKSSNLIYRPVVFV